MGRSKVVARHLGVAIVPLGKLPARHTQLCKLEGGEERQDHNKTNDWILWRMGGPQLTIWEARDGWEEE